MLACFGSTFGITPEQASEAPARHWRDATFDLVGAGLANDQPAKKAKKAFTITVS